MTDSESVHVQASAGRSALFQEMTLPDWTAVRGAGQRRSIRDRILTVAAVVTAASVIVAALGFLTVHHNDPIAPDGHVRLHGPIVAEHSSKPTQLSVCGLNYATDKVAYYTYFDGPCGEGGKPTTTYAVTTDAGRTWRYYSMPIRACVDITPVGAHAVVACELITHDDGRTWARRPAAQTPVGAIPPGWLLTTRPADQNYSVLTAINPVTGQEAPLAHQARFGSFHLSYRQNNGQRRICVANRSF